MRFVTTFACTALLALLGSAAIAQPAPVSGQQFAATAASSDMFEIKSSERALTTSKTTEIKNFARMMIKDHTAASKDLAKAARKDGVAVPSEMMPQQAALVKSLAGLPAADFDAAYVNAQLAAHKEALALMTSYAQNGDAAALKAHAQKTAPIIEMHLKHVQQLAGTQ